MTAIVIAGLLTTIAVPNFRTILMNNRMATYSNEFVTAMSLARSEAIKRSVNIDVVAIDDSNAANEWGAGWRVEISGGATIRTFPGLNSSAALNSDGDTATFQYQSSGRVSTTDTLYLCDDRDNETGRQITIAATGRVNVSDYTCP